MYDKNNKVSSEIGKKIASIVDFAKNSRDASSKNLLLLEYEDNDKKKFFIADLIAKFEENNIRSYYFDVFKLIHQKNDSNESIFRNILELIQNEQFKHNSSKSTVIDENISEADSQRAMEGMTKIFTELFPKILESINIDEENLESVIEQDVEGKNLNINNNSESDTCKNSIKIDWNNDDENDYADKNEADDVPIDRTFDAEKSNDLIPEADALDEALGGIIEGLGPQLGNIFGSLSSTLDGMKENLDELAGEIDKMENAELEEISDDIELDQITDLSDDTDMDINPFELIGKLFSAMGDQQFDRNTESTIVNEEKLQIDESEVKRINPMEEKKNTLFDILNQLQSITAQNDPITLILDDINKANPTTFEIVDKIIEKRQDLNLNIIATFPKDSIRMNSKENNFNSKLRLLSTRLRLDGIGKKIKI